MPSLFSGELCFNGEDICKDFRLVVPGCRCRPPLSAEGKERKSEVVKSESVKTWAAKHLIDKHAFHLAYKSIMYLIKASSLVSSN